MTSDLEWTSLDLIVLLNIPPPFLGMFIWTRALARLSASLASVAPVCSAPLRGYNVMPDSPVNIIDFHGLNDRRIPFSPEGPGNLGEGPDDTTIANDGYYYHRKMFHIRKGLSIFSSRNVWVESRLFAPSPLPNNPRTI